MRPLVSVVMPVYNQSHLAHNAMLSLVNQTWDNWELIVVDDGSWDGPRLKTLTEKFKDERIRYHRLPENVGLVEARNIGNYMAKGEYILNQDADDLSLPDRIEKCMRAMSPEDKWAIHGLYRSFWNPDYDGMYREYVGVPPFDLERLKREQYLPGVVIFKKELWEQKPFRLETQYAFDWMMLLDFASVASPQTIDEGLYEYVRQADSASVRFEKSGQRKESMEKIQHIIRNEYGWNT